MSTHSRTEAIKTAYELTRIEKADVGGSEMPTWDDLDYCMQVAFINVFHQGKRDALGIKLMTPPSTGEAAA